MIQSSPETTTTTPTPISPFSSYSAASDPTSDEQPDLGSWTAVFRALTYLQPPRNIVIPPNAHHHPYNDTDSQQSTATISPTPTEFGSAATTVTATRSGASATASALTSPPLLSVQQPEAEAAATATHDSSCSPPLSDEEEDFRSGSDTEGEDADEPSALGMMELSELDLLDDPPSLGYLDEALNFIAAERAIAAQRARSTIVRKGAVVKGAVVAGGGVVTSGSESAWRHVVQPRRRRRKKSKTPRIVVLRKDAEEQQQQQTEETAEAVDTTHDLDDDSSSPNERPSRLRIATHFKSTPSSPGKRKAEKQKQIGGGTTTTTEGHPSSRSLRHSRSTPTLRISFTNPPDPRTLQLRTLAHKLRMFFPADAAAISALLDNDYPDSSPTDDASPSRGRSAPSRSLQDKLIHVFIDHSNILIGFLNYLRKIPRNSNFKQRHMSHAALALILERGRPITRRVLVTSSPLYQPMEPAEQLGYEVRVYMRVPDMSGGDALHPSGSSMSTSTTTMRKRHSRKVSGHTSTESDQGTGGATSIVPKSSARTAGEPPSAYSQRTSFANETSSTTASPRTAVASALAAAAAAAGGGGRIRYREQGVDELLQLKLLQAIADVDEPPPGSTIVLATGDGNVGQFNEDGFLGPVRLALKKGWRVELYAWEDGLSKAWMREFGDGPHKDRFVIVGLEQFGVDLLQI